MISPGKSDNRFRTVLFWCLVYALALPAGWAVRVMLMEPLSNLAWVGLLFFLVWFPLRLARPDLGYLLLLTSSFGPLIGFEALFIGLEANLDRIALLLALLPLLVLFVLFVSVSVFLIPTLVLYVIRFVRSSSPERRSDVHQAQDWLGTRGVGLLKAYGIYLLGMVFGMGVGLLSRRLFGVALDATAVSTTGLLAQSLLIRFVTGGILGAVIYASVQLKD